MSVILAQKVCSVRSRWVVSWREIILPICWF